jgi:predicted subunit of tRNA(5-methylaminomethyl-2-thiouridylate) methyltransferase
MERALALAPIKKYALYSGGDDSLVTTHWAVENYGCEVLHIHTGIGLKVTRQHIRDTAAYYGWKLTEIRAKEDCGQDYRKIILEHGFPGPAGHQYMYARLKERAIELAVRRAKTQWKDKVMLVTGIRQDESKRRSGYEGREIDFKGAQMWVNPLYWVGVSEFERYRRDFQLRRGPASEMLGMSGECLCGAYANPGELAAIRLIEPETADYIEDLQREVAAAGHAWGWEEHPPKSSPIDGLPDMFRPMCVGCVKRTQVADGENYARG